MRGFPKIIAWFALPALVVVVAVNFIAFQNTDAEIATLKKTPEINLSRDRVVRLDYDKELNFTVITAEPKFDGGQAYAHVRELVSFGSRVSGSTEELEAAGYIKNALIDMDYDVRLQSFNAPNNKQAYNVVASKPKSDNASGWVAIGAHYDTVSGTSGANDNGSGVGVVLALAKLVRDQELPFEVRFVLFSSEEDENPKRISYTGSKAYVDGLSPGERRRLIGYFNIDMVGWPGAVHSIGNLGLADQRLYDMTIKKAAELRIPIVKQRGYSVRKSDHQSFERAGIPSVSLGAAAYPHHHKPSDDLGRIDPEQLSTVGRLLQAVLKSLATNLGD